MVIIISKIPNVWGKKSVMSFNTSDFVPNVTIWRYESIWRFNHPIYIPTPLCFAMHGLQTVVYIVVVCFSWQQERETVSCCCDTMHWPTVLRPTEATFISFSMNGWMPGNWLPHSSPLSNFYESFSWNLLIKCVMHRSSAHSLWAVFPFFPPIRSLSPSIHGHSGTHDMTCANYMNWRPFTVHRLFVYYWCLLR